MESTALSPFVSSDISTQLVENPPNPRRTIEALREMGYDSYASILDLIDNCIDAQAKHISVSASEHKGDIQIVIQDDGSGMDAETLGEALRLGSDIDRDSGDLGKFGMGLVTASIGLSQRVEVLTLDEGGRMSYGGFDLEVIRDQNRFVKWIGQASRQQEGSFPVTKGTLIQLSKTDRRLA